MDIKTMNHADIAKHLIMLGNVEIHFSGATGKFYASQPCVEISNTPGFLSGISEHQGRPDDALVAYFEQLQTAKLIVVKAYQKERAEFIWNGVCFVEQKGIAV